MRLHSITENSRAVGAQMSDESLYPATTTSIRPPISVRMALVWVFLFGTVINVLALTLPIYSLQVLGRAIPSSNLNTLIMLTAAVAMLLTLSAAVEWVRGLILGRVSNLLELRYRARLITHGFNAAARPDLSGLSDLSEIRGFLTRPHFTALMDLPFVPLYAIAIWCVSPYLGLLMLAGGALTVAFAAIQDHALRYYSEQSQSSHGRASRRLEALIAKIETIRALGLIHGALADWHAEKHEAAAWSTAAAERGGMLGTVSRWNRMLLQMAITGVGGYLVIEGQLTSAGMIATGMLMQRGLGPIDQLAGGWAPTLKSLAACRRFMRGIKAIPELAPAKTNSAAAGASLTVENLLSLATIGESRPLLKNLSFAVPAGKILVTMGPQRSGKSVLARLLAGANRPHAGNIRIDGVDPTHSAAPKIGYMPQTSELLPGTVAQNIAGFGDAPLAEIEAFARRLNIHDAIRALPMGYDTDLTEFGYLLSGGTQRLIALGRAAFGNPALLVLDEPAAGLDMAGLNAVRQTMIAARNRGASVVVLSYSASLADLADLVLVLHEGAVNAFGPKDQVLTPNPQRQIAVPPQPHIQSQAMPGRMPRGPMPEQPEPQMQAQAAQGAT